MLTAKKKKNAVSVMPTSALPAPNCAPICGMAGRYRSMESGMNMFMNVMNATIAFVPRCFC